MKNAIILHGTANSSKDNWFSWLGIALHARGYKVWIPDLPQATAPDSKRYNQFLLSSDWEFTNETVLIGHSSGAVAILGLLPHLPEGIVIKKAILVGAFKDDLGVPALRGLFSEPFDFETIKARCQEFIFIHSDNDPFCPLSHAQFLSEKLGGKLLLMPGEAHFSISTAGIQYKMFPLLLDFFPD